MNDTHNRVVLYIDIVSLHVFSVLNHHVTLKIIGASLSASGTALRTCLCMFAYLLAAIYCKF